MVNEKNQKIEELREKVNQLSADKDGLERTLKDLEHELEDGILREKNLNELMEQLKQDNN